MPNKRFSAEQIVTLLRQIEVVMGQGKSTQIACRDAGISEQSFRDELLNGEIFYSLKEATILIERWRYKPLAQRPPGPDWQRTDERFVDPASGEPVTVFYQPATGERRYVSN